jgi:hypothetical protein
MGATGIESVSGQGARQNVQSRGSSVAQLLELSGRTDEIVSGRRRDASRKNVAMRDFDLGEIAGAKLPVRCCFAIRCLASV